MSRQVNKKYWDNFYAKEIPPETGSDFAEFFANRLTQRDVLVLDIGCGNGRDSKYLETRGFNVLGADLVRSEKFLGTKFSLSNAVERIPEGDVIYCRFFVHTLTESEFNAFLETIKNQKSIKTIFIETRSTTGVSLQEKCETYFKSGIGTEHFRMLYSMPYLFNKISKYFNVSYIEESNQFSIFRGEEPYIIRLVCHA